jgi:hypothetical protein
LLLVILGTGVYFFIFADRDNVFGKEEAAFSVKDTSEVGMIYLVRITGESIKLKRTDSGWVLNDRHKARQNTVDNLLAALKIQEAMYPVPEKMHNSAVQGLAGNHVKAEVYDREGKKLTIFYVGSEASGFQGSYMLAEGATKPFVVRVTGRNGIPTAYYSTDSLDWRDRQVFDFRPEDISSVSLTYEQEKLNSFTVKQNGRVDVVVEPGVAGSNPLNERRAKAYLDFFQEVYAEGYVNGVPDMDSTIASLAKYCSINVVGKKGRSQKVDIYFMPLNKRSKNLDAENPGLYDVDRYFGVINNYRDTVMLQHASFGKLFVKGWQFYEADKPVTVDGVPAGE